MNLGTAYTTIKTALDAITDLPEFSPRPLHPDHVSSFPFASLEATRENFLEAGSNIHWSEPLETSAFLTARVYTNVTPIVTDILAKVQLVKDAIKAATPNLTSGGFRCRISEVLYAFEPEAKWAAAEILIQIGAYED